ncbi:diguanylate cyclase [Roseomonas sp. M0104]|uniref:diguanylate cyclase n=1 Tax=Teichococcus coralli TaxID=2545983 RepID=A0A845BQN7_9PROT|nr:diguanylate cyclase [Pseudoroseomonas coralli]MXP65709.1 diguanylate cyclase [Pseudoroseomonas coralli]
MVEMLAPEAELHAAMQRLRADGIRRLGDRVRDLTAFWEALSRRPWDAATRAGIADLAGAAHQLAGAGGTFGLPAVSTAAAPLELLLRGLSGSPEPDSERLHQAEQLVAALGAAWEAGGAASGSTELHPAPVSAAEAGEPVLLCAPAGGQAELRSLLGSLGYTVRCGGDESGPAALPEGPLVAAVVDDALPDGLGTCRSIAGRCPIILLTEDTGFPARLAAARAGVEAVVPKPLESNELADWLDQFAGVRTESHASILIVDDDPLLAEAYAMALRQAGMQVTALSEPGRTLEAIATATPDLIVMDLQMPGIDGIELARVIRQTRRHLSLPVLFLSAERDAARQLLARRLGGDDFIPKPVDLGQLVTLVRLRAERARALRAVMETDSLTGLLNHARFKERLGLEIGRSRRDGTTLSLVLLDLDHFKQINDQHGHLMGDRVIRSLARSLQKRLRRTDVIGRYGGEEFAVLLLGTAPDAARKVIDQIRTRFSALAFDTERSRFSVTFSAGIAGREEGATAEAMISAADAALYAAKRAGRNCSRLA